MTLDSLASWLRCPRCHESLSATPPLVLSCANGHSFDANKRGYVSMLGPRPSFTGDAVAMLDARDGFLDLGHYSPIRSALIQSIRAETEPGAEIRIVDAGCGTGYYLDGVLSALPDARALAFDVSANAVARTVRRCQGRADGLVADTWAALPLRDGSADAVFTVFAPRNLPEFHRVLAPNGTLHVAVPTAAHLVELRGAGGQALEIPAEKAERLAEAALPQFSRRSRTRIEYEVELAAAEAVSLVRMGPAGHHRTEEELAKIAGGPTTVSVDVVSFSRVNEPDSGSRHS